MKIYLKQKYEVFKVWFFFFPNLASFVLFFWETECKLCSPHVAGRVLEKKILHVKPWWHPSRTPLDSWAPIQRTSIWCCYPGFHPHFDHIHHVCCCEARMTWILSSSCITPFSKIVSLNWLYNKSCDAAYCKWYGRDTKE